MAQLGERLWVVVRVYLRLQEVIDLELSGLSWTPVEPRDDVDPVIGEYAEIIFDAMGEIRAAALELRAVQDLLADAGIEHVMELSPETRELIQEHYFPMDRWLRGVDGVMTEYECSV